MELLLSVLILLVALLVVLGVGVPIIERATALEVRRRGVSDPHVHERIDRREATARTRFQPLDLGPDQLRWPSQLGLGRPWEDALGWPSAYWDDDVFGNRRATQAAEAARKGAERAAQQANTAQRERTVAQLEAASATPAVTPPVEPTQRWESLVAALKSGEPAAKPPPPPELPGPEEIAALVRKEGLGGAVRALRERTGLSLDEVAELVVLGSGPR